jgi:hypothetical protein
MLSFVLSVEVEGIFLLFDEADKISWTRTGML